jgi:hypothetical protein
MTMMQQNPPRNHGLYLDDDDSSLEDDERIQNSAATPPPKEAKDDDAAIAAQYNQKSEANSKKRRKIDRPKITLERLMDPEKGLLRVVTHIPRAVQPILSKMNACIDRTDDPISRADIDVASQYLTTVLQSYQDIVMNDWLSLPSSSSIQDPSQKAVLQELLHKIDALGGKSQMKEHLSSLRIECGRNPYLQRNLSPEKTIRLLQQFEQYTVSQQNLPEQPEDEVSLPPPPVAPEEAAAPEKRVAESNKVTEAPINELPIAFATSSGASQPPKRRFILDDSDEDDE